MNALTLAQTRYTTKSYNPNRKIADDVLCELLEIVRLTPSSTNIQPWHFLLASGDEMKQKIAQSMQGTDDYNIPKILNASHIVIICTKNDVDSQHLELVTDAEVQAGRYSQNDREKMSSARRDYVALYRLQGKIPMWLENQSHIALGQLLWASAALGIDSTAIGGYQSDVLDGLFALQEQGLHSTVIVALGGRSFDDANAENPKARLPLSQILTVLD